LRIGWHDRCSFTPSGRERPAFEPECEGDLWMKRLMAVAAVLSLFLAPAESIATVELSWSGATPDTRVQVRFRADLSISGDTLTIVLTNDSANLDPSSPSLNPNDLLSSFYFDIVDDFDNRPTLTYASATGDVYLPDKDLADILQISGADIMAVNPRDNSWQFKDGLSQAAGSSLLTFGIGAVGNNSLNPNGFNGNIVDGIDYSIYAGDITTQNLDGKSLVKESATFVFTGVSGFSEDDIDRVALFGLGTQPDSTAVVPEPGTFLLACLGLIGVGVRAQLGRGA
jgi:hypothetical protein